MENRYCGCCELGWGGGTDDLLLLLADRVFAAGESLGFPVVPSRFLISSCRLRFATTTDSSICSSFSSWFVLSTGVEVFNDSCCMGAVSKMLAWIVGNVG